MQQRESLIKSMRELVDRRNSTDQNECQPLAALHETNGKYLGPMECAITFASYARLNIPIVTKFIWATDE